MFINLLKEYLILFLCDSQGHSVAYLEQNSDCRGDYLFVCLYIPYIEKQEANSNTRNDLKKKKIQFREQPLVFP